MRTATDHVMGTVVSLSAPGTTDPALFQAAATAAFAHLHHIDEVFSPFKPDSPISRIRDGRLPLTALADHPEGPGIREVLHLCEQLKQDSDGAFDAWAVGDPPHFDPCGAVKGWAAERASALAIAHGLPRHVLNAGGDVRLHSGHDPAAPWRVGITDPHHPGTVLTVLQVHDGAVATSGTTERGAHVFDPRTARPATGLAQVTVTGPDLTLADGYATAALAMTTGPDGPVTAHAWLDDLAHRTGYQALTVDPQGATWYTSGLPELLTRPAASASTSARG
ncbi:FAD:protein FMN transferase [Kitasatospora mediocidica]|uniref:FAD:protein FMN transferase n=1 Tax=Kitasatospora mediocidica TaxID=58352 RepID=UPI0012F7462C|nr:FAD:protein FMN transferase [Kitasatospora mediocidica]